MKKLLVLCSMFFLFHCGDSDGPVSLSDLRITDTSFVAGNINLEYKFKFTSKNSDLDEIKLQRKKKDGTLISTFDVSVTSSLSEGTLKAGTISDNIAISVTEDFLVEIFAIDKTGNESNHLTQSISVN